MRDLRSICVLCALLLLTAGLGYSQAVNATLLGTVGLQQRRRAGDFHGFRDIARRQLHVDTRAAVDGERDIFASLLFEPGDLHGNRVLPRGHVWKRVVSAFVGLTGSIDTGVDLGEGDFGVGNYRAARVANRAQQRSIDCLRITKTCCQQ